MTPGPTPPTHPPQVGRYEVVEKIADGGMGTVYKARDPDTGAVVAVKVISAGTARNPVNRQRFEREFEAAAGLDHPNVVKALAFGTDGPLPYLVMEYVDGESLGQRVERAGPVPEAEAVGLVIQVCDGLQRAHKQGLVHRDVKPDNVLVTRDGVAKLTDLGLVKEVDGQQNLTRTGRGLGTPHFMAPEQFRNAKGVDVRGDLYSLGATLYALVTGSVPFADTNPLECWMRKLNNEFRPPRELNPALSERVDWAIRRAMSAEPAHRPASCREFVEDLTGRSRPGTGLAPALSPTATDLWYLAYRDDAGEVQKVKGSTDGIRQGLRDGRLGDPGAVLVGRSKSGPFNPLGSTPEFRDLVVEPAPLPPDGRPRSSGRLDKLLVTPAPTPRPPATGRLPRPPSDPLAETTAYTPPPTWQPPTPPPAADPGRPARYDWTPVLAVLVALLSLTVGLLLFYKR